MWKYHYKVPQNKTIRLIIHTDCANEADDQYAVAHQLMTPKFDVKGIIAGHFDYVAAMGMKEKGSTARESYDEVEKILDLMGLKGKYPVYLGAGEPLKDEKIPIVTDAARFIIEEAMKEDDRPLYIGCQGAITDLACAILMEPKIVNRMTAIWVGGGDYPEGLNEFNLMQDIKAANVVFASEMPVWQITRSVYKTLSVSLAELEYKVRPCGKLGEYLVDNMFALNNKLADFKGWPHGELWGLGDQSIIATLMQEYEKEDNFEMLEAPRVSEEDMSYSFGHGYRKVRVYKSLDYRLTLEDFFAKMALNYKE